MSKLFGMLCGACLCLSAAPLFAQEAEAEPEQPKLPATFESFKELHAKQGDTPQGACKSFFDALHVYMNPETRDEGRKMVAYIVIEYKKGDIPWDERAGSRLLAERLKNPKTQFIFRSYAKGTSPENQYTMDPNNYELDVTRTEPDHPLGYRLFLRSTGADSPRPINFRRSKDSGLWYVSEHAGIHSEVRKPIDPAEEQFE